MIGDIIKKNTCTIEVHGYYGTETGKKAIESFLQEQGIKGAAVTYEKEITNHALAKMDIDSIGLDGVDIKMLKTMIETFKGKPVGLDTLAAVTGEETETIEDVYEPYLLQIGFISRTPRGRIPLEAAYTHLGYKLSDYIN